MSCCPNQNAKLLYAQIPKELQKLKYAVYPCNQSYNNLRFNYNKRFNVFPHAIFYPTKSDEVSYLVKNLKQFNLPFSVRSGGHCFEPGSLSSSYVIDMSKFNCVKICQDNQVVIGSGARLGSVIDTLSEKGFIVPTGNCICVATGGITLGGGIGGLCRILGLMCDNVISFNMVNADGNLIKVSENENSDLFWALRGGGNGSYGIVTDIKFKIYSDIYCQLYKLTWKYNRSEANEIFNYWQEWIQTVPDNVKGDIIFIYDYGTATLNGEFVKFGNEPFYELDKFKQLYNPVVENKNGYFGKLNSFWKNLHQEQAFSKIKSSIGFNPISQEGVNILLDYFDLIDKKQVLFRYKFFQTGGAIKKFNTSFYPRDASFIVNFDIFWEESELEPFCLSYINEFYQKIRPFISQYCYDIYVDYDIVDYMQAYYGSNKERLILVKNRYDPTNFFRWKQSIPLK